MLSGKQRSEFFKEKGAGTGSKAAKMLRMVRIEKSLSVRFSNTEVTYDFYSKSIFGGVVGTEGRLAKGNKWRWQLFREDFL